MTMEGKFNTTVVSNHINSRDKQKKMSFLLLFLGAMNFPLFGECLGNARQPDRMITKIIRTMAVPLVSKEDKDTNDFSDMRRPLHVRESLEQTGHKYYCQDCSIGFLKKRNFEQVPKKCTCCEIITSLIHPILAYGRSSSFACCR